MIQGLEKLLFKRMWLTPHHFKLAVQTMLIVLFSGFFWPRCAKRSLRQGIEGALGRDGGRWRPRGSRTRSRPGSVPADGLRGASPQPGGCTARDNAWYSADVTLYLKYLGTSRKRHSTSKPVRRSCGLIYLITFQKDSASEKIHRAPLCCKSATSVCPAGHVPTAVLGQGVVLSPASRTRPYCQFTSKSLRANTCRARQVPSLSPACLAETGISRMGPNADWWPEGTSRMKAASCHCRVPEEKGS